MKFELHKPYGKLFTPGRGYFLLEYFPKEISKVWPKTARGFWVVPDLLIDKEEMLYSFPRMIVTSAFTVEYAMDSELEIKTLTMAR